MTTSYVNYYDESNYLAKIVLGKYYPYYKSSEYAYRQSGKRPKSFIIMTEKMQNAGYRLVFFSTREENNIRFDKINSVGNRGDNIIPPELQDVDPHEYTTEECADIFNRVIVEFNKLTNKE